MRKRSNEFLTNEVLCHEDIKTSSRLRRDFDETSTSSVESLSRVAQSSRSVETAQSLLKNSYIFSSFLSDFTALLFFPDSPPRIQRIALALMVPLLLVGQLKERDDVPFALTGSIRNDLLATVGPIALQDSAWNLREDQAVRKSPIQAALYSAVLPGVGELYAESYWKAGGFFLAEAALWGWYAVNDSKGNDQTALFQQFADEHWSVVSYVEWIDRYVAELNPDAGGTGGIITGDSGPPWDRVDWAKLNELEERIGRKSGNGFTHRLPKRPEQQYYELIGKYPQYAGGWDDGTDKTPSDITSSNVSARFLEYAAMRGKANDFFNVASTMSSLIVINHVLSALDAAWSASRYNSKLQLESHLVPTLRPYGLIEFVPTTTLTYRF